MVSSVVEVVRLLAGASYLDLMVIFDLTHGSIFGCFRMVCGWVLRTFTYPLIKALQDEDEEYLEGVSTSFAYGGASDGIFRGCIGALDGLAIKIKRPTLTDTLRDPGAYYCRKGFHALNVQGICDASKKLSWISSKHIGSCHDSSAFTRTLLYQLLQARKDWLNRKG